MSRDKKGESLTALMSAFVRGYHREVNQGGEPVFDDSFAKTLIGDVKWGELESSLAAGAGFFGAPCGGDEGVRWIVDRVLSPSPLGRAPFAEAALKEEAAMGAARYVVLGAGCDTFGYRQPAWAKGMEIIEVDMAESQEAKLVRLAACGAEIPENVFFVPCDLVSDNVYERLSRAVPFAAEPRLKTFVSMMGLVHYLGREELKDVLCGLRGLMAEGSAVVFDYPDKGWANGAGRRQVAMAAGAGEVMKGAGGYDYGELEQLLEECGFLIYENLEPEEITAGFFARYNDRRGEGHAEITAEKNVNYCRAVYYRRTA